jgi:hypothetical protein
MWISIIRSFDIFTANCIQLLTAFCRYNNCVSATCIQLMSFCSMTQMSLKCKSLDETKSLQIAITVYTRTQKLTLFLNRWIQSTWLHPTRLRFILILFSHLPVSHMWAPSFMFLEQSLCMPHLSHAGCICPIVLDLVALIIFNKEHEWWSSYLCNFLQSAVTFFP